MSNATINVSDWLSALIGPVEFQSDSVPVAARANINFGPGLTVNDDGETITFDTKSNVPVVVPFVTKGVDYALLRGVDYHVTFQFDALTCTLPTGPVNGESYEIRSVAACAATIDGNGNLIDGAATYTQGAGETTVVRYNGTTTEWEVC